MMAQKSPTVMKTDYRDGSADRLVSYMNRTDSPVRDRTGRELTDDELEQFVDKSERHGFQRQIILSPANRDELTDDELDRATRRTMSEFVENRPTATYCYTIHHDKDDPDVHVALTGEKRDLYMDRQDIDETREQAHEHYQEADRDRDRREREQQREQQAERERQRREKIAREQRQREQEQERREREEQHEEGLFR